MDDLIRRGLFVVYLLACGAVSNSLSYSEFDLLYLPFWSSAIHGIDLAIFAYAAWLATQNRSTSSLLPLRVLCYSTAFLFGRLCARASIYWMVDRDWSTRKLPGGSVDQWTHIASELSTLLVFTAVFLAVRAVSCRARVSVIHLLAWTLLWALVFLWMHIYLTAIRPEWGRFASPTPIVVLQRIPASLFVSIAIVLMIRGWSQGLTKGVVAFALTWFIAVPFFRLAAGANGLTLLDVFDQRWLGTIVACTTSLWIGIGITQYTGLDLSRSIQFFAADRTEP